VLFEAKRVMPDRRERVGYIPEILSFHAELRSVQKHSSAWCGISHTFPRFRMHQFSHVTRFVFLNCFLVGSPLFLFAEFQSFGKIVCILNAPQDVWMLFVQRKCKQSLKSSYKTLELCEQKQRRAGLVAIENNYSS